MTPSTPLRELVAKWRDAAKQSNDEGWHAEAGAFLQCADALEAALSAAVYRCDYCGSDYTRAKYCCQARREYLNAHGEYEVATPPASGEAGAAEKWQADVVALLSSKYGFSPEAATVFASAELAEYQDGSCDCAEHSPEDIADLLMGVASDAVETWKRESIGRPFGHKAATPPAASGEDFHGDNAKLIGCIDALLSLDSANALVPHGIGGHARTLLSAAARRLAAVAPAGMDGGALKLDTDSQVFFYEQDFYVLSNFSSFRVHHWGLPFDTSEAAYHWMKFADTAPEIAEEIRLAPSAHEAFKVAERNKGRRRPDWDDIKLNVMRGILRSKVQQHEYVRRKLLATGDRELVENSWRDDYWGWGPNRDGHNMLGKLWMEIRAAMLAAPTPPATAGQE